jgi:hypothetical protein
VKTCSGIVAIADRLFNEHRVIEWRERSHYVSSFTPWIRGSEFAGFDPVPHDCLDDPDILIGMRLVDLPVFARRGN